MKIKSTIIIVIATVFGSILTYGAEDVKRTNATQKSIKLLTIGNSFADNVLHQLPQILKTL